MSSKLRTWSSVLVAIVAAAPAAGQAVSKAKPGFDIVWQGDGGRFIEANRKESRGSITLALQAHNFNHHRREGLLLATSALDQVTGQLTEENRRLPQFRGQRISEVKRRDRTWGRVMTRTVELLAVAEEKVAAAEQKRREEAERDWQRKKEAAERADRDWERKKKEAEGAEKERQRKKEAAEEAERDVQRQKETAERERQQRQAEAVAGFAGGRPVPVQVLPGEPHRLLQGARAVIKDGRLLLECRTDAQNWPAGGCWPLLIGVRNERGDSLGRFATRDRYTADPELYRRLAQNADVPTNLLTPMGNQLVFDVGREIASQAALIEIGFAPTR